MSATVQQGAYRKGYESGVSAERERCAKIAEAHKGSAARKRKERGISLNSLDGAFHEIRAEERGEDIAAEMIAAAIRNGHRDGFCINRR